jgi:hypothetical protein
MDILRHLPTATGFLANGWQKSVADNGIYPDNYKQSKPDSRFFS